jgi:hypothetical protein
MLSFAEVNARKKGLFSLARMPLNYNRMLIRKKNKNLKLDPVHARFVLEQIRYVPAREKSSINCYKENSMHMSYPKI